MEQVVLLGILLPALICGAALLSLGRLGEDRRRSMGLAVALGLAAGYFAAQWVIFGRPDFPPVDITHWLPYLAVAAAIVGIRESVWEASLPIRWLIRGLFSLAVFWLLLRPMVVNQWEAGQSVLWLAGLAAALLLLWRELEILSERSDGLAQPLGLVIMAAASSVALVLTYSALLGQLAGALAAALGAAAVLSLLMKGVRLAPGGVPVVAVLLAGLWVCGSFYSSLPAYSVVLLWAAPSADWVGLRLSRGLPRWLSVLIRAAAVAIPCAIAVYLAYQASGGASDYPY